jgi:hypothetical protein
VRRRAIEVAAGKYRGGESVGEGADDLFLFGKAPLLLLGEEQLSVDEDVKLAWLTDLERGVEPGFFLDRGRETRGAGFVVSDEAVLDDDALAHARIMANQSAHGKTLAGGAMGA